MKKSNIKLYMDSCREYLTKRFGNVNPEWEMNLMLLENTLNRYKQVVDSINANGIYDASTGKKNPLLATEKDILSTINKQIQHFGLSPYASAKIKATEEDDSDLLKNIMGDND